ncbi:UNVERIFIED_CONTAM: hypothetical protein FKN15_056728 [Acipenser sinensis]
MWRAFQHRGLRSTEALRLWGTEGTKAPRHRGSGAPRTQMHRGSEVPKHRGTKTRGTEALRSPMHRGFKHREHRSTEALGYQDTKGAKARRHQGHRAPRAEAPRPDGSFSPFWQARVMLAATLCPPLVVAVLGTLEVAVVMPVVAELGIKRSIS